MWWIDESPVRRRPPLYPNRALRRDVGVGAEKAPKEEVAAAPAFVSDQVTMMAAFLSQLKQRSGFSSSSSSAAAAVDTPISPPPPTAAGDVDAAAPVMESLPLETRPITPEPEVLLEEDLDTVESADDDPPLPSAIPVDEEEDDEERAGPEAQQQPQPPRPPRQVLRPPSPPLDGMTISQVGLELETSLRAFRRLFDSSAPPPGTSHERAEETETEEGQGEKGPPQPPRVRPEMEVEVHCSTQQQATHSSTGTAGAGAGGEGGARRATAPSLAFARSYLADFRAYRCASGRLSVNFLFFCIYTHISD